MGEEFRTPSTQDPHWGELHQAMCDDLAEKLRLDSRAILKSQGLSDEEIDAQYPNLRAPEPQSE